MATLQLSGWLTRRLDMAHTEQKGAYGTLTAGSGWLIKQSEIADAQALEAVEMADDEIDSLFSAWDRTSWNHESPKQINRIWLKLATAEYIDRVRSFGNPVQDENSMIRRLKSEAFASAQRIIDAGGPKVNGKIQQREGAGGGGNSRVIELRVT